MFPVTGLRQDSNAKTGCKTTVRFREDFVPDRSRHLPSACPSTGCPRLVSSMNRLFLSSLLRLASSRPRRMQRRGPCAVLLNLKNRHWSVYLNRGSAVPTRQRLAKRATTRQAPGHEQDRLAKRLNARGIRATKRFTRVTNALRVRVAPAAIPGLAKLPGVQRVERPRAYAYSPRKAYRPSARKPPGAHGKPVLTVRASGLR